MVSSRPSRVHLSIKKSGDVACGANPQPRRQSRTPAEVTCINCQRTVHMADAEVQQGLYPINSQVHPRSRHNH